MKEANDKKIMLSLLKKYRTCKDAFNLLQGYKIKNPSDINRYNLFRYYHWNIILDIIIETSKTSVKVQCIFASLVCKDLLHLNIFWKFQFIYLTFLGYKSMLNMQIETNTGIFQRQKEKKTETEKNIACSSEHLII